MSRLRYLYHSTGPGFIEDLCDDDLLKTDHVSCLVKDGNFKEAFHIHPWCQISDHFCITQLIYDI
jgi:hypothetical protein